MIPAPLARLARVRSLAPVGPRVRRSGAAAKEGGDAFDAELSPVEQPDRVFRCRRTQVHVALRRRQIRVTGQLLNRQGRCALHRQVRTERVPRGCGTPCSIPATRSASQMALMTRARVIGDPSGRHKTRSPRRCRTVLSAAVRSSSSFHQEARAQLQTDRPALCIEEPLPQRTRRAKAVTGGAERLLRFDLFARSSSPSITVGSPWPGHREIESNPAVQQWPEAAMNSRAKYGFWMRRGPAVRGSRQASLRARAALISHLTTRIGVSTRCSPASRSTTTSIA
jgi:hypothetical protein